MDTILSKAQKQASEWNEKYPVGTEVKGSEEIGTDLINTGKTTSLAYTHGLSAFVDLDGRRFYLNGLMPVEELV